MGAFGEWNTYPQDRRKNQTLIPAPDDPALWANWRAQLNNWRDSTRFLFRDTVSLHDRPDFAWTHSAFATALIPVFDLRFYDPHNGGYQIDSMLEEAKREFGGYDLVLVWCGYPLLGYDDRNCFDLLYALPGGKVGLREIGKAFHRHGVRILLTYVPWDTGTRPDLRPEAERIAEAIRVLDADGVFLDCMDGGDTGLRTALDAVHPGLVVCAEDAVTIDNLGEHQMCWGQWNTDSPVPGVLRNKWFEPRHMQYQLHRWDLDHVEELQTAWMNGSGIVIWENVFGSQILWNQHNRSFTRAMLPLQRRYSSLFTNPCGWTPLVETSASQVYANLWQADGLRLWTLVNRSETPLSGTMLSVPATAGELFFDLVNGKQLDHRNENSMELASTMGSRGLGCFLAALPGTDLGVDFDIFLEHQQELSGRANWEPGEEHPLVVPVPSPSTRAVAARVPPGMVKIPGERVTLATYFVVREDRLASLLHGGADAPPIASEFPGLHTSLHNPQLHAVAVEQRTVTFEPYAIDETPVTNRQFAEFIAATHYQPRNRENFLAHWANVQPPTDKLDHPVVYVDLDDVRAYAVWANKRLVKEQEWQFAAQGSAGRAYPWGNTLDAGTHNDGSTGETTPVRAFPGGRSPFGVYDLVGNIWEWTDSAQSDGRTRSCNLRGGSYFRTRSAYIWAENGGRWLKAGSSDWYAPQGPQRCDFSTSLILVSAGTDRRATIGFRCAVDLTE